MAPTWSTLALGPKTWYLGSFLTCGRSSTSRMTHTEMTRWGGSKSLLGSAGGNVFPWEKRASSSNFGRPDHAPRSATGPQTCAVAHGRGSRVPRNWKPEKKTGRRRRACNNKCAKKCFWYFYTYAWCKSEFVSRGCPLTGTSYMQVFIVSCVNALEMQQFGSAHIDVQMPALNHVRIL